MREHSTGMLVGILLLTLVGVVIDLPIQHPSWMRSLLFWRSSANREIEIREGLDLQGGLRVLLQADLPEDETVTRDQMVAAKGIIENRVNSLGVTEPVIQLQGSDKIAVELPGITNPDEAIQTFGGTGLLEFIDAGQTFLPPDVRVQTTFGGVAEEGEVDAASTLTVTATAEGEPAAASATATAEITPTAEVTPTDEITTAPGITTTGEVTPTVPITPSAQITPGEEVPILNQTFETVMTGRELQSVEVGFDPTTNEPVVQFSLKPEGAETFGAFTANHVGEYLAIALDKRVISSPVINSPIRGGQGVIQGDFTVESARNLVVQLKYGALPVPLQVVENRTIGPTLGEESVQRSILAGGIGLSVVILFMLLYYRLPGFLADLALAVYTVLALAVFKLVPITLTLPGIAGFILSVGMAVDANILIFERTKEELRAGKFLGAATEAGFDRAWPSIRDSNFATLITCGILFWFGSFFGASIVKGFAVTLAIGVVISMFTAIVVTRTFMRATNTFMSARGWLEEGRLAELFGI